MAAWTVMVRGIRYRAGRSLVVLLLALITTTAAVLVPAYSRAARQSVLTDGLRAAPADNATLVVGTRGGGSASASLRDTDEIQLAVNQALSRQPAVAQRLGRPIAAVDVEVTLAGGDPVAAKLAYRDNVCAHLRITGACPSEPGQVLLSERAARARQVSVADHITLHLGSASAGRDHAFVVAGVYTPKDATDGYWGRTVYFGGTGGEATGGAERIDTVFTAAQDDVRAERGGALSSRLEYPLTVDSVTLDEVEPLRDGITSLATGLRGDDLEVTTGLPAVLDEVALDQRSLGRTVPVIAVPLLLLCWFVLFLLVASLTEERGGEIALAKLRGYPSGRATRFGLAEALLLIAVAAPFGLALGLALVEGAARLVLARGTHAQLRWPVLAAAAVAVAAGVLAAVLAGRRTVGREVLALLRRVPPRTRWQAGVAEGLVVALAGASLIAALGDRGAPLALLAPPLLAVVAGIAAGRVLAIWARLRLRAARRRGRLVPLLASAQLSRRPGAQRVVVVVTVAVALLSFGSIAWDVAAQARYDHAEDVLGATRVYSVSADHPAALAAAVRRADPSGHAMAVVRASQRYSEGYVELIGVQSAALPAVAVWRGHGRGELTDLARQLRPSVAEPLWLGADLSVEAAVDTLPAKLPLRLAAVVAAPGDPPRTVPLGTLTRGVREYRATLAGCTGGCRLLGLAVGRTTGTSEQFATTLTVRSIRSGSADLPTGFGAAGRWHVAAQRAPQAQVAVRPGTGLAIDIASADPSDAVVEYVDTPDALPVVLAGPAPADDPDAGDFRLPGLTEQPQLFKVAAHAATLPRAGTRGLLFDLDYATRAAERTSGLADNDMLRYEVWASDGAPGDLPARLTAAGVQLRRTETLAGTLDQLGRRAPALGLWLYLFAGAAAIVLAIGVVLLTAYVGVQSRLYELAALRVTGVRSKLLRRAVLREYRLLLGAPLLAGLAAGVVGAALMLPGIPLVTVDGPARDLSYRPAPGAVPVALVAGLAGLGLAVLMVTRLLRRATPDRLREGQR